MDHEPTPSFRSVRAGHRTNENVPQRSDELAMASGVNRGVLAPERNATCRVRSDTLVTIHCTSSLPQSVFLCRKRLAAGTFKRYRLPPPLLDSEANTALVSAGSSLRICAIVNPMKLRKSLESDISISPVMDLALELAARQS